MVPVCQATFLNVLGLSKHRLSYVMKTFAETGQPPVEKRGGDHKTLKFQENQEARAHYCRSETQRMYLPSELSISKLYRMYSAQALPAESVKKSYFRSIFNTKYNLSFKTPRTDKRSLIPEMHLRKVSHSLKSSSAKPNEKSNNTYMQKKSIMKITAAPLDNGTELNRIILRDLLTKNLPNVILVVENTKLVEILAVMQVLHAVLLGQVKHHLVLFLKKPSTMIIIHKRKKHWINAFTMIASDYQPFTLVKDKGFKAFVHLLDPRSFGRDVRGLTLSSELLLLGHIQPDSDIRLSNIFAKYKPYSISLFKVASPPLACSINFA
ncbi:hypothetical protein NQ317_018686 [Molorchus minor]|uniref:Uncharacterized protein n=1 Tax=Molorchus minor TaxID=1323400 RepID=A0ABQ9J3J7_9CUCU|nr:hypothetical protein NQ317_018686 [Molorchus minor]